MFSDKSFDVVGFSSCWKTERELQDEEVQTAERSFQPQESQTIVSTNMETQTEELHLEMMPDEQVDHDKLASFLRRVVPGMIVELDKARKSRAFDGYKLLEDDIDGGVKKLHNIQLPDVNAKKEVRISSLSWSSTGGVVALGISHTEHQNWCDHSAGVYLFNINRQDFSSASTPNKTLETSSCVVSLSAHPFEPSILAAGTYSGEVLVWNLQRDDDCLICSSSSVLGSHREAISQVSWIRNPDSTHQQPLLVSAGRDGRILVWKVGTHSGNLQLNEGFILTLERIKYLSPEMHVPSPVGGSAMGLELGVTCFSFSPLDFSSFVVGVDGGGLLSCSTIAARPAPVDADVPLKDPVLQAFEKHQGAVTCVQFSPHHKQKFISCGTDNEIRVYNTKQTAALRMIHVEKGVLGVEWSIASANFCLAWGNSSHTVLVYNVQSGEVIPSLQLPASEKPAPITVLRQNPRSHRLIAVADVNGRVVIWQVSM